MRQGFYIVQQEDNHVKIETISYGCFEPGDHNGTLRLVFLTESISAFLRSNGDCGDPEVLTVRMLDGIPELSIFDDDEYGVVCGLLVGLITDYLR